MEIATNEQIWQTCPLLLIKEHSKINNTGVIICYEPHDLADNIQVVSHLTDRP